MNRRAEMVASGRATIETCVDGDGPAVVILASYGRDGGDDFEPITAALVSSDYRVLRPQPRGIVRSAGPMTGVVLDDIAHVIVQLGGGCAVVLVGHSR